MPFQFWSNRGISATLLPESLDRGRGSYLSTLNSKWEEEDLERKLELKYCQTGGGSHFLPLVSPGPGSETMWNENCKETDK